MDIRSPFGGVRNGADITGDAEFVTIYTVLAHQTGDYGSTVTAKRNLMRLMELIQQKVNVNYIHVSSAVVDLSDADTRTFYGLGTNFNQAATTMYTIKFIVEQSGFISESIINELIDGVVMPFETAGVPITGPSTADLDTFDVDGAATKNVNVIVSADL